MPYYLLTADQIISESLLGQFHGVVYHDDTDAAGSRFVYITFSTVHDASAYVSASDMDHFARFAADPLRFNQPVKVRFEHTAYQRHADMFHHYDAMRTASRSDQYLMDHVAHGERY